MTEAAAVLQKIDERIWRALPIELRWKIIPWAIDGGDLDDAARLIEATERERGESVKLLELRIRVATARNDAAELARLLELRAERYPSTTAAVQLARHLLDQGEVDRAADLYNAVRQTSGEQQQVQQLGDAIDRATSTPEQVRTRLQRELAANPEGIWPNVFMATWLLDNDRADAARPLLHKVLMDIVDRGADSQLLRLAELLERAGEPRIAAELREQAEAIRAERRAELQVQIEAALEKVGDAAGDWEPDEQLFEPVVAVPKAPHAPVAAEARTGTLDVPQQPEIRVRAAVIEDEQLTRAARSAGVRCAAARFRAHHPAGWAAAGDRAGDGRGRYPRDHADRRGQIAHLSTARHAAAGSDDRHLAADRADERSARIVAAPCAGSFDGDQ